MRPPISYNDYTDNPGVRYFALRDLMDEPGDAPEVRRAQKAVMTKGPVPL